MSSAVTQPAVSELRTVDLFADLSDDELRAWAEAATVHEASPGERISESGEPSSGLTLLLQGRLEMLVRDGEVEDRTGFQDAPTWIGAIPTLLETPAPITMRAQTHIRYAIVPPESFVDLTLAHRSVFRRVMSQVKPVIGRIAQREQNRERLESLGTMAAGLAHELNNPASAAKRTASDLADALSVLSEAIGVFVESGIERDDAAQLVALQNRALERGRPHPRLGARRRRCRGRAGRRARRRSGSPRRGGSPSRWPPPGSTARSWRRWPTSPGTSRPPALRWIAASLSARQLAGELAESTDQMSHLVKAIKAYAYMDRGEVVEVDVREGLETTLTILGHKLKHTTIEVERDYDSSLPKLTVHGAELNQVWTNLLDNAIDALGETGTITITTRRRRLRGDRHRRRRAGDPRRDP